MPYVYNSRPFDSPCPDSLSPSECFLPLIPSPSVSTGNLHRANDVGHSTRQPAFAYDTPPVAQVPRRLKHCPHNQCPKCLPRTYVLAPRLRETLPPKGTTFSSPDSSSTHTTSAGVLISGTCRLMHRGYGRSPVASTRAQLWQAWEGTDVGSGSAPASGSMLHQRRGRVGSGGRATGLRGCVHTQTQGLCWSKCSAEG